MPSHIGLFYSSPFAGMYEALRNAIDDEGSRLWSRRGVGPPALPGLVALWKNMFDTLFSRTKLPRDTWFIGLASTHPIG